MRRPTCINTHSVYYLIVSIRWSLVSNALSRKFIFNADLTRRDPTTGYKIQLKIARSLLFLSSVQLHVNPYIVRLINFSMFVNIRIYVKLDERKK